LHVSSPLQALPSEHDVPAATGVCTQPPFASQLSAVQGWWSSQSSRGPAAQTPAPSHCSAPLHASPSEQEVPAGFAGLLHVPLRGSQVPTSWQTSKAPHTIGFLPTQAPAWQLSVCVQPFWSSHFVPLAATGFEQTPVFLSQVPER
jgi:hypothetical protein